MGKYDEAGGGNVLAGVGLAEAAVAVLELVGVWYETMKVYSVSGG